MEMKSLPWRGQELPFRLRRTNWTAGFRITQWLNYQVLSFVGRMEHECQHCGAMKWSKERPGLCCSSGKVCIPLIRSPPKPLSDLMSGSSSDSKHFLNNIRRYNNCFMMTSFGANEICLGGFHSTFKVQGQVCHTVGSLLPIDGEDPKFLQIYFMGDDDAEVRERCKHNFA